MTKKLLLVPIVLLGCFTLNACEKGTAEKAGEKIDKAAEKTEDAAKKAADKTEDAAKKVTDGEKK
jgi:predicted small secreted protein